jgi:hypothetical protein
VSDVADEIAREQGGFYDTLVAVAKGPDGRHAVPRRRGLVRIATDAWRPRTPAPTIRTADSSALCS